MKNNLKLLFVSLGCDKNLVDTEFMLGMLRDDGIEMTDDEQEADVIIVNTCCFINDAKEESINTILEMAELKKEARLKSLIVTGCLAQRYKEEIVKEIPEVDAILGNFQISESVWMEQTPRDSSTFVSHAGRSIADSGTWRAMFSMRSMSVHR